MMTFVGLASETYRRKHTAASVPLALHSPKFRGDTASLNNDWYCLARVLATSRRKEPPDEMPLTLVFAFLKAAMEEICMVLRMLSGNSARATRSATSHNEA
eukprot:1871840-Pyramimonas_sp.AAC.1